MSVKLISTLILASSFLAVAPAYAAGSGGGGGSFGGGTQGSISVPSYDPVVEYQSGLKNIEAGKFKACAVTLLYRRCKSRSGQT